MLSTIVTVVVVLLVLLGVGIFVGKMIKGDRSPEEQVAEDNDQAAFLARIDKPHSRVDDFTSPVTGRYERKADPVVPHGSRKVVSTTPSLAGNGPLLPRKGRTDVSRNDDNLMVGGMAGVAGYGLGANQDYDLDGLPNSVDPVDLNEYDTPAEAVTVTEEVHTAESVEPVSTYEAPEPVESTPAYEPAPSYDPAPSYEPTPSYDYGSSSSSSYDYGSSSGSSSYDYGSSSSSSSYDSGSSSSYDSGSSSSFDSGSSSY